VGFCGHADPSLESRSQLKSDAGTHRIPKALRAKSRSEAETTEDGSTRWFAVVAGVSPAKPKCCGRRLFGLFPGRIIREMPFLRTGS